MAVVQTENLEKRYSSFLNKSQDTLALKSLSLEIREGETFGFLGPNGAGKTTTILLLLNLIRPSSAGRIFWPGRHRRHGASPSGLSARVGEPP